MTTRTFQERDSRVIRPYMVIIGDEGDNLPERARGEGELGCGRVEADVGGGDVVEMSVLKALGYSARVYKRHPLWVGEIYQDAMAPDSAGPVHDPRLDTKRHVIAQGAIHVDLDIEGRLRKLHGEVERS